MKKAIFISVAIILISCDSSNKQSAQLDEHDSTRLFMELWQIVEHNYAFFELRNINWEAEKKKGLNNMLDITHDSILFEEFCDLLKKFDDSHINLESDDLKLNCNGGALPDFYKEYPSNESFTSFLDARDKSLKRIGIDTIIESDSRLFQFGIDARGEWGYLRIKRFYGETLDRIQAELNDIFDELAKVENLILDIRVNPGGNDATALLCASYFFKQKEIAFIKKVRNGARHEDFSQADTTYVIPNSYISVNYREIFLLTNGASGSSADVFALVMSYLPNLTLAGTNTEGIFSDMYRDTLSNGWRITLSHERYFSKDMKCYEKMGVPVDIKAENKKADTDMGIDLLIKKITER